jgi:hypothetical protein
MKKTTKRLRVALCFMPCMLLLMGAADRRDPTRPPGFSLNPADNMGGQQAVEAIFVYRHESLAIIAGQVVRKGDRLNEFTITGIQPYTVELTGPEDTKEILQLVPSIRKEKH